jgi:hypothetical protein
MSMRTAMNCVDINLTRLRKISKALSKKGDSPEVQVQLLNHETYIQYGYPSIIS